MFDGRIEGRYAVDVGTEEHIFRGILARTDLLSLRPGKSPIAKVSSYMNSSDGFKGPVIPF